MSVTTFIGSAAIPAAITLLLSVAITTFFWNEIYQKITFKSKNLYSYEPPVSNSFLVVQWLLSTRVVITVFISYILNYCNLLKIQNFVQRTDQNLVWSLNMDPEGTTHTWNSHRSSEILKSTWLLYLFWGRVSLHSYNWPQTQEIDLHPKSWPKKRAE